MVLYKNCENWYYIFLSKMFANSKIVSTFATANDANDAC